jgi:mRNA-degrading endonuclease HigB of HigAB toxin-antitoxin module
VPIVTERAITECANSDLFSWSQSPRLSLEPDAVRKNAVAWHSWGKVKADFGKASLVGNCVVFNIGGNKYRQITRILFGCQIVFILKVLTHKEYDEDKWKGECGCFAKPPRKPARR